MRADRPTIVAAGLIVMLLAPALHAQPAAGGRGPTGQLIYPSKGQTAQQIEQDRFACHDWARLQSGFDPTQAQAQAALPAAAPQSTNGNSSAASGMVSGALGGAAVAELADRDAGRGAAIGVLGGGLRQRMQQSKATTAEQQAMQQRVVQQQAATAQGRGTYERGFAACMEGRGYAVR